MTKVKLIAMAILLTVSGAAHSANDWWSKSPATLPGLAALGYEVKGFATSQENTALAYMTVFRYVLQHPETKVIYFCSEKYMKSASTPSKTTCYKAG